MRKLTKVSLHMAVILIPLGILLMIAGILTGARRGITILSDGRLVLNEAEQYHYENYDITGIKNIHLDFNNAKIVLQESSDSKFGVKINLPDSEQKPSVNISEDTLTIEDTSSGFHILWLFGSIFSTNNEVTVYVPKGTELKDISIDTSNGRIELINLNLESIKAETSNGAITGQNLNISDNASFKTSNGEINLSGSFHDTTNAVTKNGKIIGDGSFFGKTSFKTSNGTITMENDIKRSECNISAETSNGNIRVNGTGMGKNFQENNGASNSINLDTSNGSIAVDFK